MKNDNSRCPVKQVAGIVFTGMFLQTAKFHFSDVKVKLISGNIQRIPY